MFSKQKARQAVSPAAVSQRKENHAAALEDNRTETVQRQTNKTGLPVTSPDIG